MKKPNKDCVNKSATYPVGMERRPALNRTPEKGVISGVVRSRGAVSARAVPDSDPALGHAPEGKGAPVLGPLSAEVAVVAHRYVLDQREYVLGREDLVLSKQVVLLVRGADGVVN